MIVYLLDVNALLALCDPMHIHHEAAVLAILRELCSAEGHHFWSADGSIRHVLRPGAVITHTQVTDTFLLGLAVRNGGKLATFDQRIPVAAVLGGTDALELIPVS
jgi:uncharacterized protein